MSDFNTVLSKLIQEYIGEHQPIKICFTEFVDHTTMNLHTMTIYRLKSDSYIMDRLYQSMVLDGKTLKRHSEVYKSKESKDSLKKYIVDFINPLMNVSIVDFVIMDVYMKWNRKEPLINKLEDLLESFLKLQAKTFV